MATRKVFIDENGDEISFKMETNKLMLWISKKGGETNAVLLGLEDTKEFILELNRIKKSIYL